MITLQVQYPFHSILQYKLQEVTVPCVTATLQFKALVAYKKVNGNQ